MSSAVHSGNEEIGGQTFDRIQSAAPEVPPPVLREKISQESPDDVCEFLKNDLAIRKHVKKLTEAEIIAELEKLCIGDDLNTKYESSRKIGSG